MNCYLDDSASTDAIRERLRDLCPSLFSNDDAVSTKVKTLLQGSHSRMLKYHCCFYHLATYTDYACLLILVAFNIKTSLIECYLMIGM